MKDKKIVIFASGGGSNAQAIIDYFKDNEKLKISSFFVNNPNANAINRAKSHHIPCMVFSKEDFKAGLVLEKLNTIQPDLIVLAGFLWLIPKAITDKYPQKIINIHPALLPQYGGKGMYGMNVHNAVKENGEEKSGITIHYVNEKYDEGDIILQVSCELDKNDTAEGIASKVLKLEHEHYPRVVEKLLF